jgi:hypothetical protein
MPDSDEIFYFSAVPLHFLIRLPIQKWGQKIHDLYIFLHYTENEPSKIKGRVAGQTYRMFPDTNPRVGNKMNDRTSRQRQARFQFQSLLANYVKNPAERKKVVIAVGIAGLLVLAGFVYIPDVLIHTVLLYSRVYSRVYLNVASLARIGFFFAVSIFPILWLAKSSLIPSNLKKGTGMLARLVRTWHVPIAILSIGVVTIHAYMAILNGYRWSAAYLSGTLAYLLLWVLAFFGFLRYQQRDRKWHLILAILFVALFLLHTTFPVNGWNISL